MNVLPQCNIPKLLPREFTAYSRHIHIAQIIFVPEHDSIFCWGIVCQKKIARQPFMRELDGHAITSETAAIRNSAL
jgi:hypothetical protein